MRMRNFYMTYTPFTPKIKHVLTMFILNLFCKLPVHTDIKPVLMTVV